MNTHSITRAIDKAILQFWCLRVSIRVGLVVAGLATFIAVIVWQGNDDSKYHCDNGGLAVVIHEGDTLWDIAKQYCTGSTVTAVDDLYKIYGSTLYPGQIIHLTSTD